MPVNALREHFGQQVIGAAESDGRVDDVPLGCDDLDLVAMHERAVLRDVRRRNVGEVEVLPTVESVNCGVDR